MTPFIWMLLGGVITLVIASPYETKKSCKHIPRDVKEGIEEIKATAEKADDLNN